MNGKGDNDRMQNRKAYEDSYTRLYGSEEAVRKRRLAYIKKRERQKERERGVIEMMEPEEIKPWPKF